MKVRGKSRAFTLAEVLVSTALAGIVMAAIMSSYLFLGRNLARLSGYQALESEGRRALAYMQRDFRLALSVKPGTTPTGSSVTLLMPAGEVTYSYDSGGARLSRQADFGSAPEIFFLNTSLVSCTTFSFSFFTGTDGAPTDQVTPTKNVPYSIKQIQVGFVLESPANLAPETRTRYEIASARLQVRNKRAPDGT